MFKLIFYVPKDDLIRVKESVFGSGAGKLGNYSHCSWEVLGQGQFKPLNGANPTLGNIGKVETVAEYRVEVLCSQENIKQAVIEMKKVHPYEEPAYEVFRLEDF